jgi:prepilin-type N-terminal cleavage/methylation domain-containing protein
MTKKKGSLGFTLFELLVSISIIGLLMALVSFSFSSAQKKARDAKRMQDLQALQKAAEQYYAVMGTYVSQAYCSAGQAWTASGQTILQAFPQDPKGVGYSAACGVGTSYCFCAAMESDPATGNSSNGSCTFTGVGSTAFYCVKNQQ